jgi:hypothetical protein
MFGNRKLKPKEGMRLLSEEQQLTSTSMLQFGKLILLHIQKQISKNSKKNQIFLNNTPFHYVS